VLTQSIRSVTLVCMVLGAMTLTSVGAMADPLPVTTYTSLDGSPKAHLLVLLLSHGSPIEDEIIALQDEIDVVQELMTISTHPALDRFPRGRAMGALGLFAQDPRVLDFASLLLNEPGVQADLTLLGRAILLFNEVVLPQRPEAVSQLLPLATHEDAFIRRDAVVGMALVRDRLQVTAVEDTLQQLVLAERHPEVQAALARALQTVELRPSTGPLRP